MKNKSELIISALSAFLLTGFIVNYMPDTVPVHYGISGNADRYGSRWTFLVFACAPLLIELFHMWRRTKDSEEVKRDEKSERRTVMSIEYVFILVGWGTAVLAASGAATLNTRTVSFFTSLFIGVLLIGISNVYGKTVRNHYFGIRIPQTLRSDVAWRKTHRLSGYIGVGAGFVVLIWAVATYAIAPKEPSIVMLVSMLVMLLGAAVVPTCLGIYYGHKYPGTGSDVR